MELFVAGIDVVGICGGGFGVVVILISSNPLGLLGLADDLISSLNFEYTGYP